MAQITKKYAEVLGSAMAYVERGAGDPIVFVHGNPASSYVWRGIIDHVQSVGRCVVPDLIGMGDSAKLEPGGPDQYRFVQHRAHLDALLEQIDVTENVVVVGQDWGSALAFDWARRNPDRVKGVVHMEAITEPWSRDRWPLPDDLLPAFLALRSAEGESLVLEQNMFVEFTMPAGTMRTLSDEEMAEYRRPFTEPGEGRRATLTWPREIPFEGAPADVHEIVTAYADWLATSPVPKLFVNAEPGFIIRNPQRATIRTWPNQTEVTVAGLHFVQEDAPEEIGRAIVDWYAKLS